MSRLSQLYQQFHQLLLQQLVPVIERYLLQTRGWRVDLSELLVCTRVVRMRKGQRALYIGRACYQGGWKLPASQWANSHSVKKVGSAVTACAMYHRDLLQNPILLSQLPNLYGQTLGCWCKPGLCHGDVLVAMLYR